MARKEIGTGWTREQRNAINDNFIELFKEYINAGLNADDARKKAEQAVAESISASVTSEEAKSIAERTSTELGQAILEGDSSPLGGQLSVGADGTVYNDPQQRFVKELNSVDSQLAQTSTKAIESTGYGVISGLKVDNQATPNMSVNIEAGTVHLPNGNRHTLTAIDEYPILSSDTTYKRVDLVYVNENGAIDYLQGVADGTPTKNPTEPVMPSTGVLLGTVHVEPSVTEITGSHVQDTRKFKPTNPKLENDVIITKNNNALSARPSEGVITKMLNYAQTYVKNTDKFVYGGEDAFQNGALWEDELGRHQASCSTFCHLMVKGIPYENSRYNGLTENILDPNFNDYYKVYEGFVTFRWAEWAYKNGYAFVPNDDFSNVLPTDMLLIRFRRPESQLVNRDQAFMNIEHSAMFVDKNKDGSINVYEIGSTPDYRTYTVEQLQNDVEVALVCRMPYNGIGLEIENILYGGGKPINVRGSYLVKQYNLIKPLENHKWYTVTIKGKILNPNCYFSVNSGNNVLYSGRNEGIEENDLYTYHFCTDDKDLSANNFRVLLVADSAEAAPESERNADVEWVVLTEGYTDSITKFIDSKAEEKAVFTFSNGFTGYYNSYSLGGFHILNIRVTNPNILTDGQLVDIGTISGITLKSNLNIPCDIVQQLSASPSYSKDATVWVHTGSNPHRLRIRNGSTANQQFLDISCVLPV